MPAKPDPPRSHLSADEETAARHPGAPLAGLFGDPDGSVHCADRADDDPLARSIDWTELFTRPRERRPL